MNRAFIFDMDGVLIDTENEWARFDPTFLSRILPEEIVEKIGSTMGYSVKAVYDKAIALGATIDKKYYTEEYEKVGVSIYEKSPLTKGSEQLVAFLIARDFRLGLVSASAQSGINVVVGRLLFGDKLEYILSLNDHPDLKQKPHPDGYLAALQHLHTNPKYSIILEDSNPGIQAAKAAGAYVIGFRGNLPEGYKQEGADAYADTMDDVIRLVESFDR